MYKSIPLSVFTVIFLLSLGLHANELDEALDGFDDTPVVNMEEKANTDEDALLDGFDDTSTASIDTEAEDSTYTLPGLTGKLTQQAVY